MIKQMNQISFLISMCVFVCARGREMGQSRRQQNKTERQKKILRKLIALTFSQSSLCTVKTFKAR